MDQKSNNEMPTPVSKIDKANISAYYRQLADWVRTKKYGVNVREAIAQVAEAEGTSDNKSSSAIAIVNELEKQWKNGISGVTSDTELINMRTDESGQVYKTAKDRVDAIQTPNLRYLSNSVHIEPNSVDKFDRAMNRCNQLEMDYTLVPMVNITSDTDNDPQLMDDEIFNHALQRCQEGKHNIVMLKPHLGKNWSDGYPRGNYAPSSIKTFFNNWEKILLKYAEICDENNIPLLCLSCETLQIFNNEYLGNWQIIVNHIKERYPKLLLTVAHNGWMDASKTDIYDVVDLIGINWYPTYALDIPKSVSQIPSSSELMRYALGTFQKYLQKNAEKYNKPIYFTETGIRPHLASLVNLLSGDSNEDYAVTSNVLNSFITYFSKLKDVVGVSWWDVEEPFQLGDISEVANAGDKFTKTAAENAWENLSNKYYAKQLFKEDKDGSN